MPIAVRVITVAIALPAIFVLQAGCKLGKPREGGSCSKPGATVCASPTEGFYCNGGTYMAIPCAGPKGCTGGLLAGTCDDDLANAGDACVEQASGANYACAKDRKSELICTANKFVSDRPCKGPQSCEVKPTGIVCDDSIADPGDTCRSGTFSCSSDHTIMLGCQGDKFVPRFGCRGPSACGQNQQTRGIFCDKKVEQVGDPCDTEAFRSCTADGKTLLACKGGHFAVAQACANECIPSQAGAAKCT